MAGEEDVPPWVTFILGQVREQFTEVKQQLGSLVTRDAFSQEQIRVNERLSSLGREIGELKTSNSNLETKLQAEATARVNAETQLARERGQEQKDREKDQANRRWMIFAMIATPFVAAIIAWVLGGGLQPIAGG